MLGVLIIGVLDNGLILTSVPTFFQMGAKGVQLIAAGIIAVQQAGHSPRAWRLQGCRGSSPCKSLHKSEMGAISYHSPDEARRGSRVARRRRCID